MARRRPPRTSSGLLPDARCLVLPKGIKSTGYPATEATCRQIGIEFDPWQADLNRCILAKDKAGNYAADTVVLSVGRQVGKTFDVGGVIFADSIINPGTTSVWTAHRFKVARESFEEMRGWARSPKLKQHIDAEKITTAAGNECIPFRNGSRIVFAARERGAIRGFTKVRRLVLDEAQILTEQALSDLAPTQNQAVNPQIVLMGTPPKPTDPGEVFTRLRRDALSGESDGVLYVEISAEPGSDPDDRKAWRRANPSYPKRTPAKAILRLRKLMSTDDFMREALGIWDEEANRSVDMTKWAASADATSKAVDPVALGVDVAPDRSSAVIGAAGRRTDGREHGEIIDARPGTAWLVDRVVELAKRWDPCVLVIDPKSPAYMFEKPLCEAGFSTDGKSRWRLQLLSARDYGAACGGLAASVADDRWRHLGQDALDQAVSGAGTRPLPGGMWAWAGDGIGPLVAVTLARYGFATWMATRPPEPIVLVGR